MPYRQPSRPVVHEHHVDGGTMVLMTMTVALFSMTVVWILWVTVSWIS